MVNYKRVVCEVAVLTLLAAAATAAPTRDCTHDHQYDQRQNGTENIRVNIDGVIIAAAPADAFISAASNIAFESLFDEFNEISKPTPSSGSSSHAPNESKPDIDKPQESKPEAPVKPEAQLSDVSVDATRPETKGQKKDVGRKQVKGQRLKTMLAHMLVPLIRRAHTHDN